MHMVCVPLHLGWMPTGPLTLLILIEQRDLQLLLPLLPHSEG